MTFTDQELARYARHLQLSGFGPEAQAKLKKAHVLVIGAGGLGCPALLYLTAAGVGRISIIDPDRVDVSNLQRQVLYTEADTGKPKVEAAAARLRALNSLVEIFPWAERFSRTNALAFVRESDVVIDGSDNFATRYLANDACVIAGRPLVYGAIHGFEGQASVFNWKNGPTYRCLFPEPPAPGTIANCAEAGVLGVLPGLIGTVQACEAIKLITGIGEPLAGRLWLWNALTMSCQIVTLAAEPKNHHLSELPPEGYGETCEFPVGASPSTTSSPLKLDTSVDELAEARGAGREPQLVDVRETWERVLGAIEPSSHVPLGTLESSVETATEALSALDPAKPLVVYCASGVRSKRGAELLRDRYGFSQAISLTGGFRAWKAQGNT